MVLTSVEGAGGPAASSPDIRKEDLVQARALLVKARADLEPRQWESLDGKLTEAERAWARYEALAQETGQVARVARAAEGTAEAARLARAGGEVAREAEGVAEAERIGSVATSGPLLAALFVLLYPSSVADAGATPALRAELDLRVKLREVAEAAQQVREELAAKEEAVRRTSGGRTKAAPSPKPNEVIAHEEGWQPVPGEPPWRPCEFRGGGGKGGSAGTTLPANWVRCVYQCGRYLVTIHDVWGTSTLDCDQRRHLDRAERLAKELHGKGH